MITFSSILIFGKRKWKMGNGKWKMEKLTRDSKLGMCSLFFFFLLSESESSEEKGISHTFIHSPDLNWIRGSKSKNVFLYQSMDGLSCTERLIRCPRKRGGTWTEWKETSLSKKFWHCVKWMRVARNERSYKSNWLPLYRHLPHPSSSQPLFRKS